MKSTRIEIRALTEAGSVVLGETKAELVRLLTVYDGVHILRVPRGDRKNLRIARSTGNFFQPVEGLPEVHEQVGIKRLSPEAKQLVYVRIKHSFEDAGCNLNDFEVKFHDE